MPGRAKATRRARAGVLRELNAGRLAPATAVTASGLLDKPGVPELHRAALATALGGDTTPADDDTPDILAEIDAMRQALDAVRAEIKAMRDTPDRPRQAPRTDTAAAVARLRTRNPELTAADIAGRLGISARTVRRHLADRQDTTPAAA
jgi:DNA-binding NarL/FixJ family response regulator